MHYTLSYRHSTDIFVRFRFAILKSTTNAYFNHIHWLMIFFLVKWDIVLPLKQLNNWIFLPFNNWKCSATFSNTQTYRFLSSLQTEDNIRCFCLFTIFLKKFKLRQIFQIVTDGKQCLAVVLFAYITSGRHRKETKTH